MTSSCRIQRLVVGAYLALFLAYLLLPLAYMLASAFNASRTPTLHPWRGFTLDWFAAAWADDKLWAAFGTSLLVGACVVALSVTLGLGAALLMTRARVPGRSALYAILVSPILTPGIVLGLSTAIFWDRLAETSGSWALAVLGQSSFIAAYCMLIFMARLQRFDDALEEAAADLGASRLQVFRTITLPFLAPAIYAAAALGFTQSFENYNTTLFTIGRDVTVTIYIAGKMRLGVTPAINALACVLVALTILGGIAYEIARRREARNAEASRAA